MEHVRGIDIAMLGGDLRELELAKALHRAGARLRLAGYPSDGELAGAHHTDSAEEAVTGADAVICPMSNTDAEGVIKHRITQGPPLVLDDRVFARLTPGTPLLIGQAKPVVRRLAERYGVRLVETAEVEEIALLNAIPTAEGAIQVAFQEMPVVLHGARALVIGFGRCGMVLAVKLQALSARVTVAARSHAKRAAAQALGLEAVPMTSLEHLLPEMAVVFNTAPALVLDRPLLERMQPGTLIVDLASGAGGTDFAAAAALGLKAVHALGLPGKVAPQTAGEILARTVPGLIGQLLGRA